MTDTSENGFDRVDRRLGMIWSRIGGTIFAAIGIAALLSALAVDDFSFTTYWPVFAFSALFFLLARLCFCSRTPLSGLLDEAPTPRRRSS